MRQCNGKRAWESMKHWKDHAEFYTNVIMDLVNVDISKRILCIKSSFIQICVYSPKKCNEPSSMIITSVQTVQTTMLD